MITYQIKDWNTHFENNKSREREKCSFCCIPNKQDGLGYGMLMREPDGEALYAAFIAVVLICSKQTCGKRSQKNGWESLRNGFITANGLPVECPLSARQLSVKCQLKEATIQRMLEVISSNEIGWIEAHHDLYQQIAKDCPPSVASLPVECPSSALERRERREEKEGKGNEEKEGGNASLPLLIFKTWNEQKALPQTLVLSDKRRALLKVRSNEQFFVANWREALTLVTASRFCLGENERGWKASFDWFVSRDVVTKIMEGKYDNRVAAQQQVQPNKSERDILAESL